MKKWSYIELMHDLAKTRYEFAKKEAESKESCENETLFQLNMLMAKVDLDFWSQKLKENS